MGQKIEHDHQRFNKIVKGLVRQDMRKLISGGGMIGQQGKDFVKIPLKQLDPPKFIYGDKGSGGVAQGPGEIGQPLGPGQDDEGNTGAGDEPGGHIREVEISYNDLAKLAIEELKLPYLEPKGKDSLESQKTSKVTSYHGQQKVRVHRKRTLLQAIKRAAAMGVDLARFPGKLEVEKRDLHNRWFEEEVKHEKNAALLYMKDCSGSMEDEQNEIVRREAWWISLLMRSFHKNLAEIYILHDSVATVVTRDDFFSLTSGGGTRISSVYDLCDQIAEGKKDVFGEHFPSSEWNLYPIHFTDGDNMGSDDEKAVEILSEKLLPRVNLFGYVQVTSPYGSGDFIRTLENQFIDNPKVRTSSVNEEEEIPDSIQSIFREG